VTGRRDDRRRPEDRPAWASTEWIAPIVSRALDLTPAERRRLGRWTSASLRDPRLSRALEAARDRALQALDETRERRRRWDAASAPLYERLLQSSGEERRWRIVMLATHFIALLAIVNVPGGLPPAVALVLALAAPVSAWAAWGRGTTWLGAIHAALAAAVEDRLDEADVAELRRAWTNAVESDPPVGPPILGLVGALAPSFLIVMTFIVVLATRPR
jgi:hypothetical protein